MKTFTLRTEESTERLTMNTITSYMSIKSHLAFVMVIKTKCKRFLSIMARLKSTLTSTSCKLNPSWEHSFHINSFRIWLIRWELDEQIFFYCVLFLKFIWYNKIRRTIIYLIVFQQSHLSSSHKNKTTFNSEDTLTKAWKISS